METLSKEIETAIKSFRSVQKLDDYFSSLPQEQQESTDVIRCYKRHKSWINDMLARLDPNNCGRCGMMLGYDENDNRICYLCRF